MLVPADETRGIYANGVLFYGVVSARLRRWSSSSSSAKQPRPMVGEVRKDEPVLAEDLRVEAIEL